MGLTFLDETSEFTFSDGWNVALKNLTAPPVVHHVAYRGIAVTEIAQNAAYAGIVVQPAATVLALPGWEDAYEFVDDGSLHTLFDIEKLIRMFLHGSHLALEVLGSTRRSRYLEETEAILDWTVNRRHLRPAIDSAATLWSDSATALDTGTVIDHFRRFLQGRALTRHQFGMGLNVLLEEVETDLADELTTLAGDRAKVAETVPSHTLAAMRDFTRKHPIDPQTSSLPGAPSHYEALSNWLVDRRLETT